MTGHDPDDNSNHEPPPDHDPTGYNTAEPVVDVPAGLLGQAIELLDLCDELFNHPGSRHIDAHANAIINRNQRVGVATLRRFHDRLGITATDLQQLLDDTGIIVDPTPGPQPPPSPSRDDTETTACPTCRRRFTRTGRRTYCTDACRKTAFRRRNQQPAATIAIPAQRPRRDYTIYQCPNCDERFHGQQRCPDCGVFARRVGDGGPCPHCDQPVAVKDLLDQ